MLAVKAKHATMLLTVTDVEVLPEGLQEMEAEKTKKSSAQAVMVRERHAASDNADNLSTHAAVSGFN